MKLLNSFSNAMAYLQYKLGTLGKVRNVSSWQSIKINKPMREVKHLGISIISHEWDYNTLKNQLRPNLPWADEHFEERVSGIPYNPPPSHERWPFSNNSNAEFRTQEEFSHTYPERFWPKLANAYEVPRKGIRYDYGDYQDVVNQLLNDPYTRQAYLPIFFPEDTGNVANVRVPCTLGYLFDLENGYLNITYFMRSCDAIRHLADDIYLTALLLKHTIKLLQKKDIEGWQTVVPGKLNMYINNLHCFESDDYALTKSWKKYKELAETP